MRPTCPVCNSIQTKITAKQSLFTQGLLYKCKNCGHSFLLTSNDNLPKKKGSCLWSITKFILSALLVFIVLMWFFKEDAPQKSNEKNSNLNTMSENEFVSDDTNESDTVEDKKSIEDSQDMSDTLSIRTSIRENE